MTDSLVRCPHCGNEQRVEFSYALSFGWPKCYCRDPKYGHTMHLETTTADIANAVGKAIGPWGRAGLPSEEGGSPSPRGERMSRDALFDALVEVYNRAADARAWVEHVHLGDDCPMIALDSALGAVLRLDPDLRTGARIPVGYFAAGSVNGPR